jgi:phage baseplate assembly protein W
LRFVHPDLDESRAQPGFALSGRGRLDWVEGEPSLRQALLLLLSTRPGERVMRPRYGCDLHRLVFEPSDDTTAGLAIHYVRTAIERWEPRVEIVALDAERDPESPHLLQVILRYRARLLPYVSELSLTVDLRGQVS